MTSIENIDSSNDTNRAVDGKGVPLELTLEEKEVLTGVIFTDANVYRSQVQFSQGAKNIHVLDAFIKAMQPFIKKEPSVYLKDVPLKGGPSGARSGNKIHKVYQITTTASKSQKDFIKNFLDSNGKKTVPKLDFLYKHLTWRAFGWIIMGDGSAHSYGKSQGIKLQFQNFSYEELTTLSLALYHTLGIQCWPAKHKKSTKGVQQYHIRISGRSLRSIRKKSLPFIIGPSQLRVPPLLKRGGRKKPAKQWLEWYKEAKKGLDEPNAN
jgi:hypothetical protein